VLGTAGPCCGERWVAGDPCAPVLGGEDGALARRPQAPLDRLIRKTAPRRPRKRDASGGDSAA
jgi:hypothetical protein